MSYVIGLFFLAGSAFMTWRAAQLWRRPELVDHFVETFAFMPFGIEVKRGEIRSLALTSVSLWGVTVLLTIGLMDAELGGIGAGIVLVVVLVVLVSLLCEAGVILINAPKFAVPPHMRSEPGLLAVRRARRAGGPDRLGS
ncbi:hypothetical protein ACWECC_16400 [Streptomyces microflavus]|uniref:hypothetical protein n=1 Tax=Streptomyces microflavus TaxID=1919 RepID=UPI0033A0B96E